MSNRALLRALLLVALALALGLGVWQVLRHRAPQAPPAAPLAAARPPAPPKPDELPPEPLPDAAETPAPGDEGEPFEETWSHVDLDAVRAALPDNSYWHDMGPTQDQRLLDEREEQKKYWNEQWGKVLSGTGTEEEIRAYYEHRQRSSTDAIQFVDYLLEHRRDELTERDVAFLGLARRLHLARLQEIPRRLEEAYARKREQDEARAAWLADEARFRGDAPAGDDAAAAEDAPPDEQP